MKTPIEVAASVNSRISPGALNLQKFENWIKNLSVNNVYVQLDLSECNDRCRQVVERQKAAIELFVSHQ